MAAKRHRVLVVHEADQSTTGVPVPVRYKIPPLEGIEFLVVEAADKSTAVFRVSQIVRMHLKDA